MIHRVLALLLLFTLPGHGAPHAAPQEPDVAALVAEALAQDGQVDPGVFEQLGEIGTRLALNGLCDCCDRAQPGLRPHAYRALRHFARDPELGPIALAFLSERVLGEPPAISQNAARALVAFGYPAKDVLQRVLDESEDERTRELAIGGLLTALQMRGTRAALETLLEHYRPGISGPLSAGVSAIRAFRDPECVELLCDTLGSTRTPDETRALVAAGVATLPGEAVDDALARVLRDDDPRVVASALDSLRTRASAGLEGAFARLLRHRSASVRAAAFRALARGRLQVPEMDERLREALVSDDFALRIGAAAALGDAPDEASGALLVRLIADPHVAVRREAMRAATGRRLRAAIPYLLERLEQDGARQRGLAYDALVELTGLDFGPTHQRWSNWWAGEGATFELPTLAEARAAARAREERHASGPTRAEGSFYGVRFASDRVVFVLDVSNSMGNFGRLERMQRETLAALEQIPDGARFNLVFFHSDVMPWARKLVEMDERVRLRARNEVAGQRARNGTNLHAGLRYAFQDPDVDTIVLLSDGEPSEGVIRTSRILADVREWNDLRGVVVHCVAMGWSGELLESIASEANGEFLEVR